MTTQDALVDNENQNQTAQNVQCDLWPTLPTSSFNIITEFFIYLITEVYFKPMKNHDLFIP